MRLLLRTDEVGGVAFLVGPYPTPSPSPPSSSYSRTMFCCKSGTAEKDKQPPGEAASTSNNPVADGAGAVAEAAAEEADLGGAAEAVDDPEIGEDVVSLVEQLIPCRIRRLLNLPL